MLQEKAMLANLTIHQWTARKFDKTASKEVEVKHNAKDAGAFSKRLIDKNALKPLSSLAGQIRELHYQRTLPWGDNGDRLLPSTMFMEYTAELRALRTVFETLAYEFIKKYPSLVQAAQARLGTLYKPKDYPDINDIQRRFSVSISFLPVPEAADFRVDIGAEEAETIRQDITAQLKKQQENMLVDLWQRLHEVISKAHERLSQPDAKLYDSLLENIRVTTRVVSKLNFTNDLYLASVLGNIEYRLCSINIESLRNSKTKRQGAAIIADEILKAIPA